MTARRGRVAATVGAGLLLAAAGAAAAFVRTTMTHAEREAAAVRAAGFVEKRTTIGGTQLNYAEGPDNGPAMLLVHGQLTDWRHWSRVLPRLFERHHVYAVDCYGHGGSARAPEKYTANAHAADLAAFLERVVGRPATVVGHSSGGHIAAGIAARVPERVRGVVLEDPPFFATLLPRAETTFNYVTLATLTHEFLASGEDDFVDYHLRHSAMWELFGRAREKVQRTALNYHAKHPGQPVKIFYMPPVMNELFRAMGDYDPRFGDAFYTGTWDTDFDHAATLARVTAPVALIHVRPRYDDAGTLQAAMSDEEAERTRSLLPDVELYRASTGHSFHFEDPERFDRIVADLERRVGERST